MIIGVSGKIQSGKDTVGQIIQYLISNNNDDKERNDNTYHPYSEEDFNTFLKCDGYSHSIWQIKKYADKLKDIICLLTGCTREELEDIKFKNGKLPDSWIRYGYADGFYRDREDNTVMNNKQCSKERYEEELRINWQTAYKQHLTFRDLLQYVGTDLFRDQLHEDCWVNALFADYKQIGLYKPDPLPNWIITDTRFPNEVKAIEDRGGFNIRIERLEKYELAINDKVKSLFHSSETALDNNPFKYTIHNNGTIEELIKQVKEILIKEKII